VQQHRRAGRPRLRPASNTAVQPREEILRAAAELFAGQGLAATTTRQIAERVGIRQASLYYYFSGKDEILLELLTQSVRPSLRVAATLEARCGDDPAAGLYALALIDVRTLTRAPHNIATLYLLPEVQGDEFASFRAEHAELQATYGRLGRAAAAPGGSLDEELTATLIMQLVESVIQLRRFGELRDGYAHEIAASCLRLIGLDFPAVARARGAAEALLLAIPVTPGPLPAGHCRDHGARVEVVSFSVTGRRGRRSAAAKGSCWHPPASDIGTLPGAARAAGDLATGRAAWARSR
jgi:AcrR family transcriptional regulator